VDAKTATLEYSERILQVTDLPGIYSFSLYSPEEIFARDFILTRKPDVIINIIDSTNLERNLYLTTRLLDMDVNIVIALNMYDEFIKSGNRFDYISLGRMLGIPFIPTVGSKAKGIHKLITAALRMAEGYYSERRRVRIRYSTEIETSLENISSVIQKENTSIAPRFLAVSLLEGDRDAEKFLNGHPFAGDIMEAVRTESGRLAQLYGTTADSVMIDERYGFIYGALRETYNNAGSAKKDTSIKIDNIITHKIWGYPVFLAFLWVMFACTFIIGNYPKTWIERGFGLLSEGLGNILSEGSFRSLMIDGIITGVGSVAAFLPNILILFLFISLMEDTGYMARAVFLMDKLMHRIGLHGKSFIPLIMGFGCNVPAIMAARTIENRNNKLVTILINPFMSCSARLPVYILLIGAVFPGRKATMLFAVYLTGIIVAILVAILFKKTFFRGKDAPFVMELPPYRFPTAISTFRHMWSKGSQYLKKMGGVILVASVIIWALGYFPSGLTKAPTPTSLSNEMTAGVMHDTRNFNNSYLSGIGRFIEPAVRPLGFDWKMGVCLASGIVAKETIVSTIGILYNDGVPGSYDSLKDFTPVRTASFIVFILLYFPCIATLTAIGKETGSWRWALFTLVYTTAIAWIAAFAVFNIGKLII
jgi:ferrous iron transport protein B